METGLLSVLTPLFNLERLVPRLLDSILMQTYPNVEMVVVDDGSTDNSSIIVEQYREAFEKKRYILRLIKQKNMGLSSAINTGLKYINGEFLIWPDADDFYNSPDAFAVMVDSLKNAGEDYAIARCQVNVVNENSIQETVAVFGQGSQEKESKDLFEDCLLGKNGYYYGTGAYMIRTKAFFEMQNGDIYVEPRNGQNLQLCLPVLFRYKCLNINHPFHTYVIRSNSHSHQKRSYEQAIQTDCAHENTRLETLSRIANMNDRDKKKYSDLVINLALRQKFMTAYSYRNKADALRFYSDLCKYERPDMSLRIHCLLIYLCPLLSLYDKFRS